MQCIHETQYLTSLGQTENILAIEFSESELPIMHLKCILEWIELKPFGWLAILFPYTNESAKRKVRFPLLAVDPISFTFVLF